MELFYDIVFNLTLLVTLSVISGFVNNRWDGSTLKGAIAQGLLFGVVAMVGIVSSAMITKGLFFDGRSVALSIAGLFFGPIAAIISTTITVALRIIIGGPGTYVGSSIAIISAAIGVFFFYRRRFKKRPFSTLFFLYFGFIVHLAMLLFLVTLPKQFRGEVILQLAIFIFTLYPLATILIGKILSDQRARTISFDALRHRESLFSTLTQSSPVGVFKLDPQGYITFVNNRISEILGISSSEMGYNTLRFTVASPRLAGVPAPYCTPSGPGIIGLRTDGTGTERRASKQKPTAPITRIGAMKPDETLIRPLLCFASKTHRAPQRQSRARW